MKKKEIILLILILFIAAFFRLWQLNSIPPGLYPDVAINGNEALGSLKTAPPVGGFKLFYPENNGREGLMIWLIALSFSIFGVSIWSIKIAAAIVGILTVLGLYLFTKELFSQCNEERARYIALLASFFLAISFWHTNFSRIGFRAILVPFILVFGFYFLFRGFRQKRIWDLIISGVFLGLGFYTYISYRFIVLLLPLVLICWWFIYQKPAFAKASADAKALADKSADRQNLQRQYLFSIFYFLFSIFIVAFPIGVYFLQHPQDFIGRAAPISIFTAENPIKEFGKSLILHLGMFNFYGDPNWRHNISGSPILFWPVGILFLIGIIFSIKEFMSSIKKKNCSLFIVYCSLLSWFFLMLLPGVLTYEGIPHSLRTIGAIPPTFIFAGIGTTFLYEKMKYSHMGPKRSLGGWWAGCSLKNIGIFFLIFVMFFEGYRYFILWGKNQNVRDAFSKNYLEIGNYLNSLPPEIQKYVIINMSGVPVPFPNGIPIPAQTVMFVENIKYGKPQSTYLLPQNLDQIKIEKETVIIPMRYDENLFINLWQKFPGGEILEKEGIWIYKIGAKLKTQSAKPKLKTQT